MGRDIDCFPPTEACEEAFRSIPTQVPLRLTSGVRAVPSAVAT